jgi:hypothetical protein
MEGLLNTPGKSDGLYRIWADTMLITERTKVDLRGSENQLMNEVMLDCYWNGGSPVEQNRYFDNFIISTKRIGLVKLTSENKNVPLKNPLIKKTSTVHPKARLSFSKKPSAAYVSIQQDNNKQRLLLDGRSQKIRNVK